MRVGTTGALLNTWLDFEWSATQLLSWQGPHRLLRIFYVEHIYKAVRRVARCERVDGDVDIGAIFILVDDTNRAE